MNKDNRLIAEFMRWKHLVDDGTIRLYEKDGETKHIGSLKYDQSWNLLMPVVEKIEKICDPHDGYYGVYISSNSCTIEGTLLHRALKDTSYGAVYYHQSNLDDKLSSTYQAVVLFIKWYNANKKEHGSIGE